MQHEQELYLRNKMYNTRDEILICETCGFVSLNQIDLSHHMKNNHNEKENPDYQYIYTDINTDEDVNFQCGECGQICDNGAEMSDHMKNTHKEAEREIAVNVKEEISKLNKHIKERNDLLKRKNVSLEKELRYTDLALNQSELETNQLKKNS